MQESLIDEWTNVIRKLSPQNRKTLTAMVKLAKMAENAAFHMAEKRTEGTSSLSRHPPA